jgi:hypothetical protein
MFAGPGEADEARERTAYGTGVLEVGMGAATGVVDLGAGVGVKIGVVDLGGAVVGVLDRGGVSDGGDTTDPVAGKGLFLLPGERRSLSATGALDDAGSLGTGEVTGAGAFESVRTWAGAVGVETPGERWDAGRSGEGLAGWVFALGPRVDTTRKREPGLCTIVGRGDAAVLDVGDEGPGDEGPAVSEPGREAGSAGS